MSVCSEEVIGVTQEHTHITQEHSHTGSFLGGGGTTTLKKWGLEVSVLRLPYPRASWAFGSC